MALLERLCLCFSLAFPHYSVPHLPHAFPTTSSLLHVWQNFHGEHNTWLTDIATDIAPLEVFCWCSLSFTFSTLSPPFPLPHTFGSIVMANTWLADIARLEGLYWCFPLLSLPLSSSLLSPSSVTAFSQGTQDVTNWHCSTWRLVLMLSPKHSPSSLLYTPPLPSLPPPPYVEPGQKRVMSLLWFLSLIKCTKGYASVCLASIYPSSWL